MGNKSVTGNPDGVMDMAQQAGRDEARMRRAMYLLRRSLPYLKTLSRRVNPAVETVIWMIEDFIEKEGR